MISLRKFRNFALAAALLVAAPMASFASVFISVGFAPPILPVYVQPLCPGDGYLWTPGYWAYTPDGGYYWVPGVWVQPPTVGFLWTPGYWGFFGGQYRWNAGYWGPHIGFYGGVNYGFGYGGHGYEGGEWRGGHFFYNTAVNHVGGGFHNTYVRNVTVVNNNYAHTSFSGGPNGVPARPTAEENAAMHEQHVQPTGIQQSHQQLASQNHAQFATANGGHPQVTAARSPQEFQQTAQRGGFGTNSNARAANPAAAARPQGQIAGHTQGQVAARPQGQLAARPETPAARPNTQAAPRVQAAPREPSAPRSQPAPREAAAPRASAAPRAAAAPHESAPHGGGEHPKK